MSHTYTYTLDERLDGADLYVADTRDAMLRHMRDVYLGSMFEVEGCEEVPCSDTWRKLQRAPTPEEIADYERYCGGPVRVRPPGTHPGGRRWWIEPINTVYCPRLVEVLR